jgi:hypothetical protein
MSFWYYADEVDVIAQIIGLLQKPYWYYLLLFKCAAMVFIPLLHI